MSDTKDWIGTSESVFKQMGASNHSPLKREYRDYYATDPVTIDALFKQEKFCEKIWEPACGEGHLSKRIASYGKRVRESDIEDRMNNEVLDFLTCEDKWDGDIITNPPYSKAKEFVEKSLELIKDGGKVAMFLKLTFLEGQARRKLFEQNPPKTVYVFSKRQNCARNGDFSTYKTNSNICYAWFVWEKNYKGITGIKWI